MKAKAKNKNKDHRPCLDIYTDGSCDNLRNGGWSAIILTPVGEVVLSGGTPNVTNNRMELLAVVKALESLVQSSNVTIYTDSQYVQMGMFKAFYWKAKGWVTSTGTKVQNKDLWGRYLDAAQHHAIKAVWIKGHAGNKYNEMCDIYAKKARDDNAHELLNRISYL